MDNLEKLTWLNNYLTQEMPEYASLKARFASDEDGQYDLLRALSNLRPPKPASEEFLKLQDEVLTERLKHTKIQGLKDLIPTKDTKIYLHQGDITKLEVDAIVNAANSQFLGCFIPLHNCIDNAIHSGAGVQLRLDCDEIIRDQGHLEDVGEAKITSAYNLPSKYVIHTVGPQVSGALGEKDKRDLSSCYLEILKLADQNGLDSLAFCCISTGVFGFPKQPAAEIAVATTREYLNAHPDSSLNHVVFNVFTDEDRKIYEDLLI